MAALGEGFELCKIPNGVELLGAEKHCDEDHVLLTFRDREVRVYNIADRKIVRSWSIEPKQKLSCPAVQDFSTKKYFMVRNEKELLKWTDSVLDLRNADVMQLPKPVKRIKIYSSKIFDHEPVIEFQNNEVLPMSFVGKGVKKKSQERKQRLLWCGTHKSTDGKIWFCKTLISQGSTKALLVMQSFESSLEGKQQVYNIAFPAPEGRLLCWSILNGGTLSVFISLWSDGCLYKTDIPEIKTAKIDEIKKSVLECELVSSLSEISLLTLEDMSVHLLHISLSFVCVAGTRRDPGGSQQTGDIISLWDVKFGTLHSWKTLSSFTNTPTATSVASGITHLQCTSSFVIVANKNNIMACSYRVEQSTLRNSLGMLHSVHRKDKLVKPQFLGTPKLMKPDQSVQQWTDHISKADKSEDELLRKLLDPKKTRTAKQLASELQKYFEEKCHPKTDTRDRSNCDPEKAFKQQKKKSACRSPTVSQYFVTSIFERCLNEKELWSKQTAHFLLKTKILPTSTLSPFLELVCENNEINLLQECFQVLNGIPETSVVDCLKYILRVNDDIFGSCDSPEEWHQTKPPCSFSKAKYLCLIIAYPINDVFMQESLKRLHFEETLVSDFLRSLFR